MASNSVTPVTPTIADGLREILAPAFSVKAMLQGALALIEDPGAYDDPNGEVWAAREIIEAAMLKVEGIYGRADDLRMLDRITALEGGAA